MASRKELIFSSYRRLYRARRGLFRNDTHAMRESRVAVRQQYLQHNNGRGGSGVVATKIPDDEFYNLLSMVDEAVDMMKHGIAQGNLNQNTGSYEVKLTKDHIVTNTGDTGQPSLVVEPITLKTAQGLERQREPVQVTTTTTTSN